MGTTDSDSTTQRVSNDSIELSAEERKIFDQLDKQWITESKAAAQLEKAQLLTDGDRSAIEEAENALLSKLGIEQEVRAILNIRQERAGKLEEAVALYRTRFPGHTFVLCRLA